jgi:hypothetical protein
MTKNIFLAIIDSSPIPLSSHCFDKFKNSQADLKQLIYSAHALRAEHS